MRTAIVGTGAAVAGLLLGYGLSGPSPEPTVTASSLPATATVTAPPSIVTQTNARVTVTQTVTAPPSTKFQAPLIVQPAPQTTARKTVTTTPQFATYANCTEVKAAGKAPIRKGQSGYSSKLDKDGDGIACES